MHIHIGTLCTWTSYSLLKTNQRWITIHLMLLQMTKGGMSYGKYVYHGTLECFIFESLLQCVHFQLFQPHNKLHKIDMSCLAHHLDICFGLKWTSGLTIIICIKINKNTLLLVLQQNRPPLCYWFLYHRYPLIQCSWSWQPSSLAAQQPEVGSLAA
jgi:hypothetical protein